MTPEDLAKMMADPAFAEGIKTIMAPSLAYLGEPIARSIVNQLWGCVEVTHNKVEVHNTGYFDKPEDLLLELHRLREQPFVTALPPFLKSAVMSADMFAAEFLAAPRLLKLASMVLIHCKDDLDHVHGLKWPWAEPRPHKRAAVELWMAATIAAVPQLGGTTAVFAKSADQVLADAAEFGPLRLHYVIEELQNCISRCIEVRLFNPALMDQLPFAYHVVTSMDTLLFLLRQLLRQVCDVT
jgi:hypothetical protein